MSSEVTQQLRDKFMADKCMYDSLSQAIKLLRSNGCSDKQIKPLTLMKQEYKKTCSDNSSRMLRAMPLSNNIVQLDGSWYGIRYLNEKADTCLKIDILRKDDVKLIQRDGRYERELTRRDIESLLPGMLDDEALELYKQHLTQQARALAYGQSGVLIGDMPEETELEEPMIEEEKPIVVSFHAGKRWAQRVIGIKNEQQAEDYYRKHMVEVNEAVLSAYGKAEKVWEDEDNITYWFDADNIMYVRGIQDGVTKVITLYEEDFGFTKEINRMIALKQLEVLASVRNGLREAEAKVSETNARVDYDVQTINDEITVLESQIAVLVSQRAKAIADRDLDNKQVKANKDKYVAEFNKLFKKWDA